ncbi:hypothetical protein ABZT26_02660 [Streptomyces sp. NPDC005395]|uniref:hypothetical protein n=1 Tax=unclassified Streptomyces TaxID=2593676 RepID=UPI001F207EA0|nr:hypothetical protein [Streptomyces sp. BSE6.1]
MNAESIATLTAAGVAIVGIPTTVLVGRWQLKGVLQTAERGYRASLDAVKAAATESHIQWQRGTRRDAYATFLLTAARTLETADLLVEDSYANRIPPDERNSRKAALKSQVVQLQHSVAIVSLEGPERLALRADLIRAQLRHISITAEQQCIYLDGWHDVTAMARADGCPDEVVAYVAAAIGMRTARGSDSRDIRKVNNDQLPESVRHARDTLAARRIPLPISLWVLANDVEDFVYGKYAELDKLRKNRTKQYERARTKFVDAARDLLGAGDSTPTP